MKRVLCLIASLWLIVGCNPAKKAYDDLLGFTEYVEQYGEEIASADWTNIYAEYTTLVENVDSQAYTKEELVEIGKLKGRCAIVFAKSARKSVSEGLFSFMNQADGFLQALTEEIDNYDGSLEEIDELISDEDISEIGGQLESLIESLSEKYGDDVDEAIKALEELAMELDIE